MQRPKNNACNKQLKSNRCFSINNSPLRRHLCTIISSLNRRICMQMKCVEIKKQEKSFNRPATPNRMPICCENCHLLDSRRHGRVIKYASWDALDEHERIRLLRKTLFSFESFNICPGIRLAFSTWKMSLIRCFIWLDDWMANSWAQIHSDKRFVIGKIKGDHKIKWQTNGECLLRLGECK